MNNSLRWYSRVVWLGIGVNAIFWVPALFYPSFITDTLRIDPDFHTIWLRNTGMLLILVALFNAAAALDPVGRRVVAWLVVVARLIAASFFLEVALLNSFNSSDRPEVFFMFFAIDATFGIVKGILLRRGLRVYDEGRAGR